MNISIFDYGAGNLHSLIKAIGSDGWNIRVERNALAALEGDILVLPGVGAFGPAAAALAPHRDVVAARIAQGHPCLGICLGLQLLFDASDEGSGCGLGIFEGRVTRLDARQVPHIGWNTLDDASDALFAHADLVSAYYANGYAARPRADGDVIAWSTHESDRFPAAVRRGRTLGVQFHPEKSSNAGVRFLRSALQELAA